MSPNDDTKTAITTIGSTGTAMTTHTTTSRNSSHSCNGTASTSIGLTPPIVDLGTEDVEPVDDNNNDSSNTHIRNMMEQRYGERLVIPEWEQEEEEKEEHTTNSTTTTTNHHTTTYRSQHGWKGNDLIHSSLTSNVHLMDTYYVKYNTTTNTTNTTNTTTHHAIGTKVTGRVHFTQNAESHRGYCHGGAACSIMDDIIGWTAFCCGDTTTSLLRPNDTSSTNDDRIVIPTTSSTTTNGHSCCCIPWSGYTVQVNTKLCRPIPIAAQLYIQGTITNIVRRKVYVTAVLYNDDDPFLPNTDDMNDININTTTEEHRIIYATGEGIVVMNHGIL